MANVTVDYGQLGNTANQLQRGQGELESQLRQLKGMVDNLVTSGFVTEKASKGFHEHYQRWDSSARNIIAVLDEMQTFLKTAIHGHQELDSRLHQSSGG